MAVKPARAMPRNHSVATGLMTGTSDPSTVTDSRNSSECASRKWIYGALSR